MIIFLYILDLKHEKKYMQQTISKQELYDFD